jgi:hypothetical protein
MSFTNEVLKGKYRPKAKSKYKYKRNGLPGYQEAIVV